MKTITCDVFSKNINEILLLGFFVFLWKGCFPCQILERWLMDGEKLSKRDNDNKSLLTIRDQTCVCDGRWRKQSLNEIWGITVLKS